MNKDILVAADDHEGGLCLPKSSARLTQESGVGYNKASSLSFSAESRRQIHYCRAPLPSLSLRRSVSRRQNPRSLSLLNPLNKCGRMSEPSKVIHIRNVGHEIAESDLLQLLQPFGMVSKIVMLRAKNQALLQMEDLHASVSALQYYTSVQPSIRGRNVYMQFSSHQELTTDQSSHGRNSDQGSEPNRILLVTIHHMIYPITVEILHQVFKAYGFVEKIVTFQKSAG
ncbi:Polypyrimidine tract-binding protein homolog 3 [Zea mays]|nr:Polypyrimidine tract-binding protein homolog 3 [Zea mays]